MEKHTSLCYIRNFVQYTFKRHQKTLSILCDENIIDFAKRIGVSVYAPKIIFRTPLKALTSLSGTSPDLNGVTLSYHHKVTSLQSTPAQSTLLPLMPVHTRGPAAARLTYAVDIGMPLAITLLITSHPVWRQTPPCFRRTTPS